MKNLHVKIFHEIASVFIIFMFDCSVVSVFKVLLELLTPSIVILKTTQRSYDKTVSKFIYLFARERWYRNNVVQKFHFLSHQNQL